MEDFYGGMLSDTFQDKFMYVFFKLMTSYLIIMFGLAIGLNAYLSDSVFLDFLATVLLVYGVYYLVSFVVVGSVVFVLGRVAG